MRSVLACRSQLESGGSFAFGLWRRPDGFALCAAEPAGGRGGGGTRTFASLLGLSHVGPRHCLVVDLVADRRGLFCRHVATCAAIGCSSGRAGAAGSRRPRPSRLPAACLLIAVACFRLYQIPQFAGPPNTAKPDNWEAFWHRSVPLKTDDWEAFWHQSLPLKTDDPPDVIAKGNAKRELYDQACAARQVRVRGTSNAGHNDPNATEFQQNLQAHVDLMLAASRLDGPYWATDWSDGRAAAARIRISTDQMIEFADGQTKRGNLDAALEVYFAAMRAEIDAARWAGLRPTREGIEPPQYPSLSDRSSSGRPRRSRPLPASRRPSASSSIFPRRFRR